MVHAAEEAIAGIGQIPRDLRHPLLVRLTRDPRDLDSPSLELHDEEDAVADQAAQGQYFDGETVGRRQGFPMSGEKRLPRRLHAALRDGRDAEVPEDRLDR